MATIALIVQPGATPSSVTTALDMFNIANRYLGDDACRVATLSVAGGAVRLGETVSVETEAMPEGLPGFDAVMLPGFFATDSAFLFGQFQSTWQPVIAQFGGGHDHARLTRLPCRPMGRQSGVVASDAVRADHHQPRLPRPRVNCHSFTSP